MPIRIHKQLEEKLESMLNKLISLKNKGINMFFTDIDIIRKKIEEI
ncbi:syntaphilin domain-containing protein [Peptoanaerobacter stomatis]|nr:syntaphilin domain-containing protein [Peptoanaerobacter stomatis]